jgi:hypothetical protein
VQNEQLNFLYSSPNIIWVIESRKMRSEVHVACMGRRKIRAGFWWRNLEERDIWEAVSIDEKLH